MYLPLILEIVAKVGESQQEAVTRAAQLIRDSLRSGGIVQAFGSGHSEALAMEIAGRAGGLVPTNRLALRDIVLQGGQSPEVLADPLLERNTDVAHQMYALHSIQEQDVFVIASNSGINGVVVELAQLVKANGHQLIAITSSQTQSESRHPSGKRLTDFADVVLDNGAPHGDAAIPLPTGGAVGGVSSVTAAVLAQMIVTEVVLAMVEEGEQPPIYLSANIAGGHEHNTVLEARYAGRIRRTA